MRIAAVALLVSAAVVFAQNYRCDWSVVGIGGGEMSSAAYRCGSTAGQTAAGLIESPSFLALIGFWQGEVQTGIREEAVLPSAGRLTTRLEAIAPNPSPGRALVRYSLAKEGPVGIVVHDLAGRAVRQLVSGWQRAGRYTTHWRGVDDAGRELASGVYFLRFSADGRRDTEKLVLQR